MRLDRIGLDAWGHFAEGVRLELPARGPDLYLLYGANEAGKSTLLRGVRALFLGMGRAPVDGHQHGANRLALSARATLRDGRVLEWRRTRQAKKAPLTATLDGIPLDEAGLAALFGGIDLPTWESLYGFSGQDLAAGAARLEALRLSEVLLSDADPEAARAALEAQAEALLSPSGRGKKAELLKIGAQLAQLRTELDRLQLRPAEWEERNAALARAKAAASEARAKHEEAAERVDRAQRLLDAHPHLDALMAAQEELSRLPPTRGVGPDGQARLEGLRRAESAATQARRDAEERLAALQAERAALEVDPALEAEAPALRGLVERRAAMVEAARELPAARRGLEAHRAELDAQSRTLVEGGDPTAVDRLSLTEADREVVDRLAADQRRLAADRAKIEEGERNLAREAKRLEEAEARLEAPTDLAAVRAVLAEAAGAEDRLARLAVHRRDRERLLQERSVLRRRLVAAWPEGAPEPTNVPPVTWIDHWEQEHERAGRRPHEEARRDRSEAEKRRDQLRADLAALTAGGALPTAEALAEARAARAEAWAAVRSAWLGGTRSPLEGAGLAAEYERQVERVDAVADAMIAGARTLAERQALEARLREAEAALARAAAGEEEARARLAESEAKWAARWTGSGLQPASPPEMRRVVADLEQWSAKGVELAAAESAIATEAGALDALNARFDAALRAAGLYDAAEDLPRRLDRAREALARAEAVGEQRNQLRRERERLEMEAEKLRAARARLDAESEALDAAWHRTRAAWGIPARFGPDQAPTWAREAMAVAAARRRLASEAQATATRERDLAEWEAEVHRRTGPLAPPGLPPDAESRAAWAAEALRRLDAALRDRDRLDREIPVQERVRDQRLADETAARRAVAGLLDAAKVEDDNAYAELARVAARRAELEAAIAKAGAALVALRRGETADTFDADVRRRAPEALSAELEEAKRELRRLADARDAATEARSAAERRAEVDSSAAAAEVAAQLAAERRRLREGVRRWLVLTAARRVLERTLARFEREQVPALVDRMSELFRLMTEGRYRGVDRAGEGPSGLRAVTADGETREAAQLSEGTGQQLYLAARLAWAEHHARSREALPLVLDDVLVAFDDRRAAAALRVLAGFAQRQQVLLFTHHRHVVELAQAALPGLEPVVLGPRGGAADQPPT